MLASRLALATLALVACAWFGLGISQTRDQTRATTLLDQRGTPTAMLTSQILHLLDGAATLNPDRRIDLLRAQAEVRAGDPERATRTMERVVRDEPLNVDAWIVLGFAAGSRDPALARLARARERELAPPARPAS